MRIVDLKLVKVDVVQTADGSTHRQSGPILIHQIPELTGRAFHLFRFTGQLRMDRLATDVNAVHCKSNVSVLNCRPRKFIFFLKSNLHLVNAGCETVAHFAAVLQVGSRCRCR